MSAKSAPGGGRPYTGDSYFVSLNDLLVGMLFIFIILLMAFALSYQSAESDLHTRIGALQDELSQRASLRASLLDKLGAALTKQGIKVKVDAENGVLRLPEKTLFASGSADLGPPGHQALQILATTLADLLPCYSSTARVVGKCPKGSEAILEAVYVEGHTDNVPIVTSKYADNWALSSDRAIKTYQYMLQVSPVLKTINNADGTATLFGTSAYAEQRPVHPNNNLTTEGRAENRRIDLRFLLAPPGRADLDPERGLIVGQHP